MIRLLYTIIAVLVGTLAAIISAWAQQADGASLSLILGTAGGAFATAFGIVIAAVIFCTKNDSTA